MGKSFILNLLLFNSAIDHATYSSESWRDIRDQLGDGAEAMSCLEDWKLQQEEELNVKIQFISDEPQFKICHTNSTVDSLPGSTTSILRSIQSVLLPEREELHEFLLPSKSSGTITTPLVITVSWGYTWQLAYRLHSKIEVLSLAFEFVALLREVSVCDFNGPSAHDLEEG